VRVLQDRLFLRLEQVERNQPAAEWNERGKGGAILGDRDARAIRFQEFGIAAAIGGCVEDRIDPVEQVARPEVLLQIAAPMPRLIEKADLFGLLVAVVRAHAMLFAARDAVTIGHLRRLSEHLAHACGYIWPSKCAVR